MEEVNLGAVRSSEPNDSATASFRIMWMSQQVRYRAYQILNRNVRVGESPSNQDRVPEYLENGR